ncbi:MAG TPA: hypothetical protein VFZ25_06415 [Chloroflexota bacterium]|nr:hypothetical protein [Chloroflexota bacterium]
MLRVVFDTGIFVRALINPRGIWGRLVLDQTQNYIPVLSKPVIEETLEVIDRPIIKQKYRLRDIGMRRDLEIRK